LPPALPIANELIGYGGEIAWPNPTRPGDVVHIESEIIEIKPSTSKPDQGMVTVRSAMSNQNGEVVYLLTAKLLVFRRLIRSIVNLRGWPLLDSEASNLA